MPASKPDLCILGMDPAGFDLALAAAQLGARVMLVTLGGDSGRFSTDHLGWLSTSMPHAHSADALRAEIAADALRAVKERSLHRLPGLNVTVLDGPARFTGPKTIEVKGEIITPRAFILACGRQSSAVPALSALLAAEERPRALRVTGSGADAVGLATQLLEAGFGVVLDAGDALLPEADPEAASLIEAALARKGVRVVTTRQPPDDDISLLTTIDASSRAIHLDGLSLDAAGLSVAAGDFAFGPTLMSSNPRIYGIGTITDMWAAPGAGASQIGYLLARLLLKKPGAWHEPVRLRQIAIAPELLELGKSEAELRASGQLASVHREALPASAGRNPGFVKLMADRRGRVLGAVILGEKATLLAPMLADLIARGGRVADLAALPPQPVRAGDVLRLIGVSPARKVLQSKMLHRLVRFMRVFG